MSLATLGADGRYALLRSVQLSTREREITVTPHSVRNLFLVSSPGMIGTKPSLGLFCLPAAVVDYTVTVLREMSRTSFIGATLSKDSDFIYVITTHNEIEVLGFEVTCLWFVIRACICCC